MSGKLFTAALTTTAAQDLIGEMKTLGGFDYFIPKKVTIIADASLSIKINGVGAEYSPLYEDAGDSKWKISLDSRDVLISDITPEENGVDIWIAVVF